MKRKIYLVLTLIWMGVIFYMSNQPATISAQHSGGVVEFLSNLPYIGNVVTYMMEIDIAEFIVRKSAHMFSYFVLAILLFNTVYEKGQSIEKVAIIALIGVFLYACTDEFHQLFIPGRSGEFKDVMIDTTGGFIGSGILYLYYKLKKECRKRS